MVTSEPTYKHTINLQKPFLRHQKVGETDSITSTRIQFYSNICKKKVSARLAWEAIQAIQQKSNSLEEGEHTTQTTLAAKRPASLQIFPKKLHRGSSTGNPRGGLRPSQVHMRKKMPATEKGLNCLWRSCRLPRKLFVDTSRALKVFFHLAGDD